MEMERNRYIYKIFAGDDLLPFYVGVGNTTSKRRRELVHSREAVGGWAHRGNAPKKEFIRDCIERGIAFRYEYERHLTTDDAHAREIELVLHFGRRDLGTGCLFNACAGGWGTRNFAPSTIAKLRAQRHTEETKARIAASHIGIRQSDESRAKIKAARAKQVLPAGEAHKLFGTGSQSPEALKLAEATRRYRARQRGENVPLQREAKPKAPKKPRGGQIGSKRSEETKALLSAKKLGAGNPNFGKHKTHCKRGHEYTEANTIIRKSGVKNCRECKRLARAGAIEDAHDRLS